MMKTLRRWAGVSVLSLCLVGVGFPSLSQSVGYEEIGRATDWTAIRFSPQEDRSRRVCAIFSRPMLSEIWEGNQRIDPLRGERASFLTWEEGVVSTDSGVVSFLVGAQVLPGSAGHRVVIDEEHSFELFGHEDRLFADPRHDRDLVARVRAGVEMEIQVMLPEDRRVRDVFSLRGVMASTNMAMGSCNS